MSINHKQISRNLCFNNQTFINLSELNQLHHVQQPASNPQQARRPDLQISSIREQFIKNLFEDDIDINQLKQPDVGDQSVMSSQHNLNASQHNLNSSQIKSKSILDEYDDALFSAQKSQHKKKPSSQMNRLEPKLLESIDMIKDSDLFSSPPKVHRNIQQQESDLLRSSQKKMLKMNSFANISNSNIGLIDKGLKLEQNQNVQPEQLGQAQQAQLLPSLHSMT